MRDNRKQMIAWLVSVGGKPKSLKWKDIAEKFNIRSDRTGEVNTNVCRKLWHRHNKEQEILELRKRVTDGNGKVISKTYGRAGHKPEIDYDDYTLAWFTTNAYSDGIWGRYVSNEHKQELERLHKEISDSYTIRKFKIGDDGQARRGAAIGCCHVPYHDKKLWYAFLDWVHHAKIDFILILGDFLDMKSISSHEKDKVFNLSLAEEYAEGLKAIMELEDALPKHAEKYYLYGNHEYRFIKIMKNLHMAKIGDAIMSPVSGLKLEEFGYKIETNYMDGYFDIGNDLRCIHGNATGKSALSKTTEEEAMNNRSVIFPHTHLRGTHSFGKFTGYNLGGFFDKTQFEAFGYAKRTTRDKWQQGFVEIIEDKGRTYPTLVRCDDSRFYLDNKKWK